MTAMILVVCVLVVASMGCGSDESQGNTIVLYGFSIMEEVTKDEIIPAFQEDWKARTGRDVRVITSFGSSGTVTNQIIFGRPLR